MPDAEREQRLLARLDHEYARRCMQQLVDLGPHKIAGTDREHAAASWIEQEMRRLGLEDVRSEPFPVAVRDLAGGATVEILGLAGKVFDGFPMAGSWPTPADGIEGEVVYVGEGIADDYAAGVDVRGKIALRIRHNAATAGDDGFLRTMPVLEAWARGAIGVIVFDELAPPDAVRIQNYLLGSHESEVRIPIVSLAARDAQVLLARLEEGPLSVRLRSTSEQRDGVSHNVVGMVRGSRDPDEYVILATRTST
jgi:hypothetical protein